MFCDPLLTEKIKIIDILNKNYKNYILAGEIEWQELKDLL